MAAYDIYQANEKRKLGVVFKCREEFIKKVTDRVLLSLFRSGRSIEGMIVGQIVIPIPILGGFVGAVLGLLGGQLIGKSISETSTETAARLIEKIAKELDNHGSAVESE